MPCHVYALPVCAPPKKELLSGGLKPWILLPALARPGVSLGSMLVLLCCTLARLAGFWSPWGGVPGAAPSAAPGVPTRALLILEGLLGPPGPHSPAILEDLD